MLAGPRPLIFLFPLICAAFAVALSVAPAADASGSRDIIVRYDRGVDSADRRAARAAAGVVHEQALPLPRTEVVTPTAGTGVAEAVAELERSPDVAFAEPDVPRRALLVPDDPLLAYQWPLRNDGRIFTTPDAFSSGVADADIDALEAWDRSRGDGTTVAVVDSGIDSDHPDLAANVASGGVDLVDPGTEPADPNGHGTHVAGVIGAVGGNAQGISGVAPRARLLALRVLDESGRGTVSTAVMAYALAAASPGVRVVNLSIGGSDPSQAEYEALRAAPNVLFVAAAGNRGADNDATASYPCAYDLPNVVCVASSSGADRLASSSNYGTRTVALAAPGVSVLSTLPRGGYGWMSGTSMAAPHVAGAAAVLLAQQPGLRAWQVRQMLLASTDRLDGLSGLVASGGRLNADRALDAVPPDPAVEPAAALRPPGTASPAQANTPPAAAPVQTVVAAPAAAARRPGAPTSDRTAPGVSVTLTRASLRRPAAAGVRPRVGCSERCTVRLDLLVDAATARRMRLGTRPRTLTVGTAVVTVEDARRRAGVVLRLSGPARRALARAGRLRLTLRATAADPAGNRRTLRRRLTLAS